MQTAPAPDRRRRITRAADELLLGGGAAVVAAMLVLAVVRVFPIQFSVFEWEYRSGALIWKTPWGFLIAFAPMGLLLAALAFVLPRGLALRTSLAVWATLALWSVGLLYPEIHGWASLVLAIGLALPIARVLARRWEGTRGALRVSSAILVVLALVARPLFTSWQSSRERAAVAALPAPPADAPNVLFIIWDTVRASSLSLYGAAAATTPVLDSLAGHGVTFDQAFSTAPWTLPSHGSIFTGRYASATRGEFGAPIADDAPTLAEALRARGWITGGFTANVGATREASGLARGFIRYEDFTSSFEEVLHSTPLMQADFFLTLVNNIRARRWRRIWFEFKQADFSSHFTVASHDHKRAPRVASDFLAWQATIPDGRPYFAFLNFWDAHAPYRAPSEYLSAVRGAEGTVVDRYHASIRYVDHEVGVMLGELARRGALDNTIVVITSDHGEQFGEHGLTLHSNSLYRQLLHVPLLVVYPRGVPAGVRVTAPVSLRDLPATALALVGVARDSTGIEGRSLAPLWSGGAAPASEVVSEVSRHYSGRESFGNGLGPMESLVADSLHIIRDGRARIEAYDLARDLLEERNLAAGPLAGPLADMLAERLDQALARNVPVRLGLYARDAAAAPRRARRDSVRDP